MNLYPSSYTILSIFSYYGVKKGPSAFLWGSQEVLIEYYIHISVSILNLKL